MSLQSLHGAADTTYGSNQGNASLVQLSQGQIFKGTVTDIRNNQVTIQIDQQYVHAKFQDMVNICIGETLNFVVRENTGKQVTIAPFLEQNGNPVDGTIYKALEAAGLAATDKNIDIVNTLLSNGMGVDKQTITMLLSASLRFPDLPLSQLVDMMKNKLPLTNDNVQLWNSFLSEKEDLTTNLNAVMKELPIAIADVYEHGDIQAAKQLLDTILHGSPERADGTASKEGMTWKELLSMIQKQHMDSIQQLDGKTILEAVREQMEQGKSSKLIESFMKHDLFSQAVNKELTNQWGITPEQVNGENIKAVGTQMEQQLQNLQNMVDQRPDLTGTLQQALQQASTNLATAQQLNQSMAKAANNQNAFDLLYSQIPLKLKGQLKHSDLYVYCNKQSSGNSSKNMSILLHLDMEYLGDLDIMLRTQDYQMNATFSLSDQEAYEIIRDHIPELEERLREEGYFFSALAQKKEEKKGMVQELFEEKNTETVGKRFSFDVRA